MRWMTLCIAACWLLAAEPTGVAATPVTVPSPAPAACLGCHELPAEAGCAMCHAAQVSVLAGPMATRERERGFARRAFGAEGDRFFATACGGCHVASCRDCHGDRAHPAGRPQDEACLRCHQGYFTGWEYYGRSPREDHERYRRGPVADGVSYLKMLPDVHQERGLGCVDCHEVHAAHGGAGGGAGTVRACRDCHADISRDVPEHAIAGHLEKMECSACHSAWAAQEYGTFLVRPTTEAQREAFAPLPLLGEWRRSAALRRQDPPPLGLNGRGLVSPIRPEFILFVTDTERGQENRLLVAEWKAFFPHTVRRGTVTCSGCHEAARRFLLEEDRDRIYLLERDGLPLRSWWDQTGQRVVNGAFFPRERYDLMNRRTPEYVREYLRQWQSIIRPAAPSSRP